MTVLNPIVRFSGPIRCSLSSVVLVIDYRWVHLRPYVCLYIRLHLSTSQRRPQPRFRRLSSCPKWLRAVVTTNGALR